MIFVTIGSMFPFDRMIRAMDAWAADAGRGEEILAQIGAGDYEPRHMTWVRKLDRPDLCRDDPPVAARRRPRRRRLDRHRGRASAGRSWCCRGARTLGEHTSDHQVETVGWLRGKPWVHVADDEGALPACIAAGGGGRRRRRAGGADRRSRLHRPPAPLHRGLSARGGSKPATDARETSTGIFSPKALTPRSCLEATGRATYNSRQSGFPRN